MVASGVRGSRPNPRGPGRLSFCFVSLKAAACLLAGLGFSVLSLSSAACAADEVEPEKPVLIKMLPSILDQPKATAAKRTLIDALKRLREGDKTAKTATAATAAETKPITLAQPLPIKATALTAYASSVVKGQLLSGQIIRYDLAGFDLQELEGKARRVAWRCLDAETVFKLHESLLKDAPGQRWMEVGRFIATLPGGRPWADRAFSLALERDPALASQKQFCRKYLFEYVNELAGVEITRPALTPDEALKWSNALHWTKTRERIKAGQDLKSKYRVIGEHLLLADYLLGNEKADVRSAGMGHVREVAYVAADQIGNYLLALAVADVFLIPNLDCAAQSRSKLLSQESIIGTAINAYYQARDYPRLLDAHKLLLANASNPDSANAARYRIAHVYSMMGDYENGLRYLEQIQLKAPEAASLDTLKADFKAKLLRQQRDEARQPTVAPK